MRYLSSVVPLDGTKDGCSMRYVIFYFREVGL